MVFSERLHYERELTSQRLRYRTSNKYIQSGLSDRFLKVFAMVVDRPYKPSHLVQHSIA